MNLLLTNDDGYGAEGLEILKNRLKKDGHKVYVMAPAGNRSGVSHGMNFDSLEFTKKSETEWTCAGLPVDCVVSSLSSDIFPEKIDAVISGINAGANIGTDVVYSGTCAAARQAAMSGIPGIAVSIQPVGEGHYLLSGPAEENVFYYEPMADFIAGNLEKLIKLSTVKYPSTFVSINALSIKEYQGAVLCNKLSERSYMDLVGIDKNIPLESSVRSTFNGDLPLSSCEEGCDYYAVIHGNVAVNVIYSEPVSACVDGISFSL